MNNQFEILPPVVKTFPSYARLLKLLEKREIISVRLRLLDDEILGLGGQVDGIKQPDVSSLLARIEELESRTLWDFIKLLFKGVK